jgi:hypothetical protein
MPVSTRNERRVIPRQRFELERLEEFIAYLISSNGEEIVVIHQDVNQMFQRALRAYGLGA